MKTAFVFPGQGAQFPGMAKDLFDASPEVRALFALASQSTGIDCERLLFSGTEEELKETVNTQISMTLASLSAAAAVKARGIRPDFVAGFSLGEYAALVEAGVITAADVFPLVQKRGAAMAKAAAALDRSAGDPGMAAVIGLSPEAVVSTLAGLGRDDIFPANQNSPVQTVISGTAAGLTAATEALKAAGARRVIALKVSGPFHSPLLKAAAEELAGLLEPVGFSDPKVPLYSNVTGDVIKTGAEAKALAVRQVIEPVRWTTVEAALLRDGVGRLLETGPGAVLAGLWGAFNTEIPALAAGQFEQIGALSV